MPHRMRTSLVVAKSGHLILNAVRMQVAADKWCGIVRFYAPPQDKKSQERLDVQRLHGLTVRKVVLSIVWLLSIVELEHASYAMRRGLASADSVREMISAHLESTYAVDMLI